MRHFNDRFISTPNCNILRGIDTGLSTVYISSMPNRKRQNVIEDVTASFYAAVELELEIHDQRKMEISHEKYDQYDNIYWNEVEMVGDVIAQVFHDYNMYQQ